MPIFKKRENILIKTILYDGNNIPEIEKFLGENYTISTERRPNGYSYIHPGDIRFKVNDYICKRDNNIWIGRSFDEG